MRSLTALDADLLEHIHDPAYYGHQAWHANYGPITSALIKRGLIAYSPIYHSEKWGDCRVYWTTNMGRMVLNWYRMSKT